MTIFTVDLPEDLVTKLDSQEISEAQLQRLIIEAIEGWLGNNLDPSTQLESQQPLLPKEKSSPTMAELWAELKQINAQYPIDFEVLRYVESDDAIRVGDTRVRLDTVIYAFNNGQTAEEIVSRYPALNLAQVYAVIAYYLRNQALIDEYLHRRADVASQIQYTIEAQPEYQVLRERLLTRQQHLPNTHD